MVIMKRFLYYLLPASLGLFARKIIFLPADTYDYLLGKSPYGAPLRGKIFSGYGDYVKQGEKFLDYFREFCGLQPHHAILEVGCGIDRMTLPLSRFLKGKGSYDGFNIGKSNIGWCNKYISAKYPNFHFKFAYRRNDTLKPDAIKLPYEDSKFDFVFLTSAFTHMMPAEVEHYINEIGRVMKPGATSLMPLFIVNCESEDLMIKQPTQMNFPFNKGFYRLHSLQVENKFIAYDEEWLLEKLSTAGLKMEGIKYGKWCGRKNFLDYEDLLICVKV